MNALRSFLGGLLKPSLLSVIVTLGLAVSLVLGALFFITPERVVSIIRWHQQYALNASTDAQLITADGFELLASQSKGPGIILLGSSTMREGIDVPYLQEQLAAQGKTIEVHDLTFAAQRLIDSIMLIDFIPPDFRGVVVVGTNTSMGRTVEVPRLIHNRRVGLLGDSLIEEAPHWTAQPPVATGLYGWDNRCFLLGLWQGIVPVLPKALFGKSPPRERQRHFYLDLPLKSDKFMKQNFKVVAEMITDYEEVMPRNLEALERLRMRLEKRGLRMVLLENPVNPAFVEYWGEERYARHIASMQAFAARHNISYFNVLPELNLQREDYIDWGHVRTRRAHIAFTTAFATRMAPLFKQEKQL